MLYNESMFYNEDIILEKKIDLRDKHNQTAIHIRNLTNELKEIKSLDGDAIYKRKDKVFQLINEVNKFLSQPFNGSVIAYGNNPVILLILVFYLLRIIIIRSETKHELRQAKKALDGLKNAKVRKEDKKKIDEKIKQLEELIEKAEEDRKLAVDIDFWNKGNMKNRDAVADKNRKNAEYQAIKKAKKQREKEKRKKQKMMESMTMYL